MRLHVGLTFHAVYYAPFYVAFQRGLFREAGLDLSFEAFGDGRQVQAGLESGSLDVGIGGIMRSLEMFDRGVAAPPIHFAEINARDGFFLIGRDAAFDWPDLIGRRLMVFAEAPTPRYILRGFLIERGLDPERIEMIADRPVGELAVAFRAGEADFLEAPAPVAEEIVGSGAGVVLRSMGEETGSLPYSSYAARPDVLASRPDAIGALARAHAAALAWMQSVDGAAIWQTIAPSFAGEDPAVLARAVVRYHRIGAWSGDGTIPRSTFDRLAHLLRIGGLIERVAPYEVVCRDDLARAAVGRSG